MPDRRDRNEGYIIVQNHPEGLVPSQFLRDGLFSTGRLIEIVESGLHSLQADILDRCKVRPLGLILWGVRDRYGVVDDPEIEVLIADSWGDCHSFLRGLRPGEREIKADDGYVFIIKHWAIPGEVSTS